MSILTLNLKPQLPTKWLLISCAFAIIFLTLRAIPQRHAEIAHADDAIAIRHCINFEGPNWHKLFDRDLVQYWQSRDDPNTFYQTCQLPDGRWGLQAIRKNNGHWWEKTSFIKGEGTLKELLEYLAKIGKPLVGTLP